MTCATPWWRRHCQNGDAAVCLASQVDGITCPHDSCDIDDGIRKGPALRCDLIASPAPVSVRAEPAPEGTPP